MSPSICSYLWLSGSGYEPVERLVIKKTKTMKVGLDDFGFNQSG
jgi:hypothetical protein